MSEDQFLNQLNEVLVEAGQQPVSDALCEAPLDLDSLDVVRVMAIIRGCIGKVVGFREIRSCESVKALFNLVEQCPSSTLETRGAS
jgi:hypothetical protein